MEPCRLYLVTPDLMRPGSDASFAMTLAQALDGGDVAAVQLRLKEADDDTWRRHAETLRPVVQSRGVAFLLNDRADLVLETGADGVHVGQDDLDVAAARALLGPKLTVGVTCHDSRDLAMRGGEAGADYVAFGAFFPTTTKDAQYHAEPEILAWWSELMELPAVAIGGITAANCAPLVQAGAAFLAVANGVWAHPDGAAAGVAAMIRAISQAGREAA